MQKKSKSGKSVAITSVWSHHDEKKKGNYLTQERQILSILPGKEMTARQIRRAMCRQFKYLELSSCHRAINTLLKKEKVKISKLAKCQITGKTVRYYKVAI